MSFLESHFSFDTNIGYIGLLLINYKICLLTDLPHHREVEVNQHPFVWVNADSLCILKGKRHYFTLAMTDKLRSLVNVRSNTMNIIFLTHKYNFCINKIYFVYRFI